MARLSQVHKETTERNIPKYLVRYFVRDIGKTRVVRIKFKDCIPILDFFTFFSVIIREFEAVFFIKFRNIEGPRIPLQIIGLESWRYGALNSGIILGFVKT